VLWSRAKSMSSFDQECLASGKRLFGVLGATAATVIETTIPHLYKQLGLGHGFFRSRMPEEVAVRTTVETWAYLSALFVCLVETWPSRPGPEATIRVVSMLEDAALDSQRINHRPNYEAYRLRFRTGRSSAGVPDSKLFGPMNGIHAEFTGRLAIIWAVPQRRTREFLSASSQLTEQLERSLRAGMESLWPVQTTT
jgi:hypothetical protein